MTTRATVTAAFVALAMSASAGLARADDASSEAAVDASPDVAIDAALESAVDALAPNGAVCAAPTDCASGFCIDSVCCERACTGTCEACDGLTLGACVTITGAPHGTRACASADAGPSEAGTSPCAIASCDGKSATSCDSLPGKDTPCGSASCTAGSATAVSACDGKGNCAPSPPTACSPYVCSVAACRTDCATNADCASGFVCHGVRCEKSFGTCSDDGLASIASDGTRVACAPYRCDATIGECRASCASDSDCAAGNHCDGTSALCLSGPAPAPAKPGGGGCTTPSRAASSVGALGASLLALLATTRWMRRRAR